MLHQPPSRLTCPSVLSAPQELEEQQAAAAAAAAAKAASKPTLRQRLDAGGAGEEAILQNPLQLHKVGQRVCGRMTICTEWQVQQ